MLSYEQNTGKEIPRMTPEQVQASREKIYEMREKVQATREATREILFSREKMTKEILLMKEEIAVRRDLQAVREELRNVNLLMDEEIESMIKTSQLWADTFHELKSLIVEVEEPVEQKPRIIYEEVHELESMKDEDEEMIEEYERTDEELRILYEIDIDMLREMEQNVEEEVMNVVEQNDDLLKEMKKSASKTMYEWIINKVGSEDHSFYDRNIKSSPLFSALRCKYKSEWRAIDHIKQYNGYVQLSETLYNELYHEAITPTKAMAEYIINCHNNITFEKSKHQLLYVAVWVNCNKSDKKTMNYIQKFFK